MVHLQGLKNLYSNNMNSSSIVIDPSSLSLPNVGVLEAFLESAICSVSTTGSNMAMQLDVAAAPPHTCEDAAEDWRGETLTMESLCMNCYKNVGPTLGAYCLAESSACVNLNSVMNYFYEREQCYELFLCNCRVQHRCCSQKFRTSVS